MRLTANVNIKIKKGYLPHIAATLYKNSMEISSVNLVETENFYDSYTISVIYSSRKEFNRLINALKKADIVRDIFVSNTLEDVVRGGLIVTTPKFAIDSRNDIDILIYGATALAQERIEAGLAGEYLSLSRNVALVCLFKKMQKLESHHYFAYLEAERDGAIVSRFLSMNVSPLIIKYTTPEDVAKVLKSLEDSFSIFRFLNSGDGFEFQRNILSNISKPVIFKETDDEPILLLSIIKATMERNNLKPEETSIGFVGINKAIVRATEVLNSFYAMKILGYDHNDNMMMTFENSGGLATNMQNVVSSCDICIWIEKDLALGAADIATPGSILIFWLEDSVDSSYFKDKGVRQIINVNLTDLCVLLTISIKILLKSGELFFSTDSLDKISSMLAEYLNENYSLPSFFSEGYERLLKKLQIA